MARPKKDLVPSAPLGRTAALIAKMREGGSTICSASDVMKTWKYIDFCNPQLNIPAIGMEWLFGARGLLAGRIIQLRATYSKGKSSFMYYMYACAQKPIIDAYCYHIETEGAAAPPDFLYSFNCNPDQLAIDEVSSFEDCTAKLDTMIAWIRGGRGGGIDPETGRTKKTKFTDPVDADKNAPLIMGVDSLSSLGFEALVNQDVLDMTKTAQPGKVAKGLREYLSERVGLFRDSQALVMLSSHETAKINTGGKKSFGQGPEKTAKAQEAIGVHATYAVDVDSHKWMDKEAGVELGNRVTMYTFKNKLSPRYRKLEIFMRIGKGFDMVETDTNFLLTHPASPLSSDEAWRQGGINSGIKCPMLSDKVFKTNEDFIRTLYANTEVLMKLREKMRIRGFGFDFETKYQQQLEQAAQEEAARTGRKVDEVEVETADPDATE